MITTLDHAIQGDIQASRSHISVVHSASTATRNTFTESETQEAGFSPSPDFDLVVGLETSGVPTIRTFTVTREWNHDDERKFKNLVIQKATGRLSADDAKELNALLDRRRTSRNPRLIEDVLFEHKRVALLRQLESTLHAYVMLIKA